MQQTKKMKQIINYIPATVYNFLKTIKKHFITKNVFKSISMFFYISFYRNTQPICPPASNTTISFAFFSMIMLKKNLNLFSKSFHYLLNIAKQLVNRLANFGRMECFCFQFLLTNLALLVLGVVLVPFLVFFKMFEKEIFKTPLYIPQL